MGRSREAMDRRNAKKRLNRKLDRLARDGGWVNEVIAEEGGNPVIAYPSSECRTVEELRRERKSEFDRRRASEEGKNIIDVKIPVTGPFGILFFGDPHIDDPGTNQAKIESDIALVQSTPGLYAVSAGDIANHWVGKLAHLSNKQTVTEKETWILVKWFIESMGRKLLFLCGGNHDAWAGDGDPVVWIAEQNGTCYQMDEIRMGLVSPNGNRFVGTVRHKWKGNSMWNAGHAMFRGMRMGRRDDFAVGAHTHSTQIGVFKDPASNRILSVMQLASYKQYDDYPVREDMINNNISPSGVLVFDPDTTVPTRRIVMFIDSDAGAAYLKALRKGV